MFQTIKKENPYILIKGYPVKMKSRAYRQAVYVMYMLINRSVTDKIKGDYVKVQVDTKEGIFRMITCGKYEEGSFPINRNPKNSQGTHIARTSLCRQIIQYLPQAIENHITEKTPLRLKFYITYIPEGIEFNIKDFKEEKIKKWGKKSKEP